MIVSYNIAKYLFALGYTKDCRYEYWNGVLHSSFDSYRPIENTIPAPDILDAFDWIASRAPYTLGLAHNNKGYYAIVKNGPNEHVLPPCNKPSEAIVSAMEYVATKALEN